MARSKRHPNQEQGLRSYYGRRKDSTERAFRDAMDRLHRGTPLLTDGRPTLMNLCREAKRGRATLDRYPDVKKEFLDGLRAKSRGAPQNLHDKVRELQQTIRQLRSSHYAEQRALLAERDRLAEQVYLLGLLLERIAQADSVEERRGLIRLLPAKSDTKKSSRSR